ncbi:MAG: NgoFVII family restriction endonuclease [Candidatus Moraniibacteriota bacterium]
MFLNTQDDEKIQYYLKMLKTVGALSRLFSESNEPYIQYRIAENLFCKSFNAENLSRTDCSADASKAGLGIGIKTFLEKNGSTLQKIAEFNSEHSLFRDLSGEEKLRKVAELRNERLETTKRIFGLDEMIYHCVTRKEKGILVYETPMHAVQLDAMRDIRQSSKNVISFEDGLNEYAFNVTKSTLYKRFSTASILYDFPVEILENPFDVLAELFGKTKDGLVQSESRLREYVYLPLYSMKGGEKLVPEKSGLNQWNAGGRARVSDEVYIRIPSWIHDKFPGFFPPRDIPFILLLPNGSEMSAKVCQDGSKALMSNPNSALGNWLLRDVLNLKERELLTYDKLRRIGLDSVVLYKNEEGKYDIDFTKIGSFERFTGENQTSKEEPED